MTRAYSITAEAIAAESQRVGGDPDRIDITRVIALDSLELRPVGPRDVRLRILREQAEGRSLRAIADGLAADGVPTARGGTWTYGTVAGVLRAKDLRPAPA